MKLFEIKGEMICLDKVVRFSKERGDTMILDEFHIYGESTYKENPLPYHIHIAFVNDDRIDYKYRTILERDEVFDKLVQAFKEE